jgi:ferredoxin
LPELLHIDWTACDGRGLCTELLPEILDRDEWGYPIQREGVVPEALAAHARRAVKHCPRMALKLRRAEEGGRQVDPVRLGQRQHLVAGA